MNRHFTKMLSALSAEGAEYPVVGAFALAAHGYVRATGDLDIWVRPTPENAEWVMRAIERFHAPLQGLTRADLCTPDLVFQIGLVPVRIDILKSIAGVDFDKAWSQRTLTRFNGEEHPTLSRQHLLENKRAAGRPKDLNDALWLEQNSTQED